VEKGRIFCLLGENGAGKTTIIRIMLQLLHPDSGKLKLFGKPANAEHKSKIGFVLDHDGLLEELSIRDNLAYAMILYGQKATDGEIKFAAKSTGIYDLLDEPVNILSSGLRKRCSLARALVTRPEILILDEPTKELDPRGKDEYQELLCELSVKEELTVFVATNDLLESLALSAEVGFLSVGELHSVFPAGSYSLNELKELYYRRIRREVYR
jgi:ABC-2 type transport system ATP-binding protein